MKQRHNHPALILLLLAMGLTACTSFSPTRMKEVIREDQAQRADSLMIGVAVAGHVEAQVSTLPPNEPVYLAYYDSTRSLIIDNGIYDISTTSDSSFSLVRADTVIPRTLSVAMRNVGGVYRPKDYPQTIESDGGKAAVLVIIVILALVAMVVAVDVSLSRSPWL